MACYLIHGSRGNDPMSYLHHVHQTSVRDRIADQVSWWLFGRSVVVRKVMSCLLRIQQRSMRSTHRYLMWTAPQMLQQIRGRIFNQVKLKDMVGSVIA